MAALRKTEKERRKRYTRAGEIKWVISHYSFTSIAYLKFYSSKSNLVAQMNDKKVEQLQNQNMMNQAVTAERQCFIANIPQEDK